MAEDLQTAICSAQHAEVCPKVDVEHLSTEHQSRHGFHSRAFRFHQAGFVLSQMNDFNIEPALIQSLSLA